MIRLIPLLFVFACGYSEAEMLVERDHARVLNEALKRLEEHYMQCEDMLVKEVQSKQTPPH